MQYNFVKYMRKIRKKKNKVTRVSLDSRNDSLHET